ncbi:hypothetical protein B0H16DRAFT_1470636 [Mycena metata]|uniref:Uncharacterized protein n=1 Tax=Mycena metata TaxID=1033252 RepID=A0AAD7MR00_9AGAR|nr:hypothetical protein B0H16DRAFT_1470636 [Mycena metata]
MCPTVNSPILRVSAERHPYLTAKRFPPHWATSAILQRLINSVRAYSAGKANPTSGVNRRRQKVTKMGRAEAQRAPRYRVNRVVASPPLEDENQVGGDHENMSVIPPGTEEQADHDMSPAMNPEPSDEEDESEEERLALEHRESSSELESDLDDIPIAKD